MNMFLPGMEDEHRDHALSQWFTPPWLAQKVALWALRTNPLRGTRPQRVLEPSAGNGALVSALFAAGAEVTAIEIDERHLYELVRANGGHPFEVKRWDFLALMPADMGPFDLCVMNPPYEDGKDVRFIMHAFEFAPIVVGVFRSAIVHGEERYESLWRWVDITGGKWLRRRPQFGTGAKAEGARSDFVVLRLRKRKRPREAHEEMALSFGWW